MIDDEQQLALQGEFAGELTSMLVAQRPKTCPAPIVVLR